MSDLNGLPPDRLAAIRFGRRADWIITVAILVIAVVFIYMLQDLPQRATFFPWFITICVVLVVLIYSAGKLRDPGRWDLQYDPAAETAHGAEKDTGPPFLVPHRRGILRAIAVFLGVVIASLALGPKIAVPAFVALGLWFNGENKVAAVLSGIAFWAVVHFVFGIMMSINLPPGVLLELLG